MQRVIKLILVAVLCVLTSATLTATGQSSSFPQIAGKFRKVAEPIPDRYFVVFKDEVERATTGERAAELARAHGGKLLHVYGSVLNGFAVQLPEAAAVALSQNPLIKYVEEDYMLTVTGSQPTPQDSSFYGIDRIDQRSGLSGTYDYNRVGTGVHVYVLDTGIRTTHQEFGTRADVFRDFIGGPLTNNHGTLVAGVIGATNYGVAKNALLHSVRVCQGPANTAECPSTTVAAGVDAVVQFGSRPAVINMSFAGRLPVTNVTTMEQAIINAMNAGVTCVAGAGNGHPVTRTPENVSNYSPARLANLITVGATDKFDNRASYSNFGSGIDLFAPGGEAVPGQFIPSPSAASDTDIEGFTGTSAATPHVSGIAALYLEANPSATHFQVRDQIVLNATSGAVNNAGSGSPTLMAYSGFVAPPQSLFDFSAPSYSVSEGVEGITVVVTRSGDLSGNSKVDYQTIDDPAPVPCDPTAPGGPYPQGTAYARCDYATTLDTLFFAPGESQKSFRIPLTNDSHVEQPETFTIVLSNPVGATLGAQFSATITINSDDTGAESNPINNHQFFVRQHYLDFLSREPESAGFNAWLSVLNNCPNPFNTDPNSSSAGCDRIAVSSSFFRSQEFELKGLYVYKFYRVAFHNPPSSLPAYADISRDMRSVTGQTAEELYAKKAAYADGFVQRPTFRAAYDGLSNAAYVSALLSPYNLTAITTRDPANPDIGPEVILTQAELTSRLDNSTLTRPQVLRAVVESREVNSAEFNGAFVAMQYYGYLRRTPEEAGYTAWLNYLNANPTDFRTMVHGFLYSQEYMLRFGPISSSNLASGQPAAQSSEGWGGAPARANDGNTDGNFWNNSVTHTLVENQPWWQTDLGGARTINSVQLWNRTDCCMERLSNFYVLVSDAPFTSTDLQTTLSQPGVSGYYTGGQGGSPTTVVVNRTGRYVRVQLGGSDCLSLAEVQVWGR